MRPQPLLVVNDVEASSRWYQRLLGCRSDHGGREYERLVDGDRLVMQLHAFDVAHDHGPIGDRDDKPYGNGVLLWFEIDDFDAAAAARGGAERRRRPAAASQSAGRQGRSESLGALAPRSGRLHGGPREPGRVGGASRRVTFAARNFSSAPETPASPHG